MDVDDPDHTQAARQLHQALESACHQPSRKPSRPGHDSEYAYDDSYSYTSSTPSTGRFSDADEEYTLSISAHPPSSPHSLKRRRSNDWDPSKKEKDTGRWPWSSGGGRGSGQNSTHGSPRVGASGRHGRQAGPRGRRSRFVEGMMNDSVSEKPPSIFLREGRAAGATARGTAQQQRGSGIFRFGKAIASAFNPFGGWGGFSREKHQQQQQQKQDVEDDIARVERAYAELKRAGYRGAVKGEYSAGAGSKSSGDLADETWRAVAEKMDETVDGRHSRQESGGSFGVEVQEVRRAKSSLGIASSFIPGVGRRSEDAGRPELRKQRSKREKLLRRVSTLEEKLEKARRELQELMGDDVPLVPERSHCLDPAHQRKFVPGVLPTLPSERLLLDEVLSPVSPTESVPPNSLLENVQRAMQDRESETRTAHEDPESTIKTPAKSPRPATQSLIVESPSLKRKSPDPESASAANTPRSHHEGFANHTEEGNQSDSSRKTKLPKMLCGDSPGSVERKQTHRHMEDSNRRSPSEDRGRRRRSSQPLRSASKRSPSARRRASNSRNRVPTPSLRMKKGRADLRSASVQAMQTDDQDKENQHAAQYRRDQQQPDQASNPNPTDPSPNSSPTKRKDQRCTYNYIPPVPPLPKDLAATAAKVDRRLAKEIERREARNRKPKTQSGKIPGTTKEEGFRWPDDIF
ncbi:hypothetical protein BDV23DRAFT_182219 [Aspergillus alliaceus]|uniref:Nuclear RNA binding protein n=1 Tax=Petromyces alliaceus TaxID=209559 RepID=A0A5N7CCH8_PETAA|nr:hypothetical protein BDV23DRAFT_182219 [Aspergillus alliaceus]